jgi:hypothetical protein
VQVCARFGLGFFAVFRVKVDSKVLLDAALGTRAGYAKVKFFHG